MGAPRELIVLGSTGSIGTQALDIVRANPTRFRVVGLAAGGSQPELFAAQVAEFAPRWVSNDGEGAAEVAAHGADVVLNAITGAAGLRATLATLESGSKLALANKESLVIGGPLVKALAAPGQILPVDSEHSAIWQALQAGQRADVRKIILTASGGPFRGWPRERMLTVTPEQALKHPTWQMGRVVTINSATLVNKGLELIEAGLLFDVPYDQIRVVVHPQSVVHSAVEFVDGSTIAQCSPPDMKLPISLALGWPDRVAMAAFPVDWTHANQWDFEPLDEQAFPAVTLARQVAQRGGVAPAIYNAANEVAVDAFCAGQLGFLDIVDVIARTLGELAPRPDATLTLDDVLTADAQAREVASSQC
ncbi:MAG: 1-deoxy-D-xylulose-5-phosphate reductoisomerase [Propionibacteriaceae bacterium]|jgi:1-deoxy-D-xylulose-5-phosphate reductoisomerase|nr:1-deoxy-D-xylulose-5-phosphate reductoisomerase [Propionibacteriaceae bacterium]